MDECRNRVVIINGPNLNMLGKRNPEVYGPETLSDTMESVRRAFPEVEIMDYQSNSEGDIIDAIQKAGADPKMAGIVINPGAYAHYSYAIADAIADSPLPVVEVHISNIHAREEFRSVSVTARAARGVIAGLGRDGYPLAVRYLLNNASLG